MINILIVWALSTVLVMIGSYIIPGINVDGWNVAIVVALILGILNAFVRPILGLIALPITILTLGLFALVLNAAMVWLASLIVTGFDIDSFWSALFFSIFMALASAFLGLVLDKRQAA